MRLTLLMPNKFDDSDIVDGLDLSTLKRPNQMQKKVNVDFPTWMIDSLDKSEPDRRYPSIHY